MLPTPCTSHVDLNRVYEPAEDSFLLLDTLSSTSEVRFLTERFTPRSHGEPIPSPLILEVGTGSGVVLAFITAHAKAIFGRSDVLTLGTDNNTIACQATQWTVAQACKVTSEKFGSPRKNSGSATFLGSLSGDLATPLRSGTIDVLVFNPPYVPTANVPKPFILASKNERELSGFGDLDFESDSHLLSLSYAGGTDGMEVTDRLLDQIPSLLNHERGTAYILLCKQNKPEKVMQRIRDWGSEWTVDIAGHSGNTGGWEKLQIIKIYRAKSLLRVTSR